MICRLLGFIVMGCSLAGCSSHDPDADYSTSTSLAFNLLKICIERTLSIHSEFNTPAYLLDLSEIETLKGDAIDSFYKIKNAGLTTYRDDSSIAVARKNLSRSRVLDTIILKIIEIDYIDKKNVFVKLSKSRSANQIIKVGLDLKREGESYKIIKSEIRR